MYAYSGVLTALLRRATSGVGATVEVAMLDALGEWMAQPAYHAVHGGADTRRTGAKHASIAPYGPYLAGDGNQVFLSVQSDREWVRLCREVLRRPELTDDPRFIHNPERVAHDHLIGPLIEAAFAAFDADQVVELLGGAGIACARLRRPAELFTHPQLTARERLRQVRAPGGVVEALLPPADIADLEPVLGPVPRLGEHNDALRAEFEGTE